MDTNSSLSKLGVVVVVTVIGYGVLFGMLFSVRVSEPSLGVVCGTNLHGLGIAMTVYANDYDGRYPKLGTGPWSQDLGFVYDEDPVSDEGPRTITSSLYLLVREADVAPKSFVCPMTKDIPFTGANAYQEDGTTRKALWELWDFGDIPYPHVSYAYHNPYSRYPVHNGLPAAFPVAADMSPWFGADDGTILLPERFNKPPQIITLTDPQTWPLGNSINHRGPDELTADGQNVLFADGHTEYLDRPNAGINRDNLYTFWADENTPGPQDIQGGKAPDSRLETNNAKSEQDAFLAI